MSMGLSASSAHVSASASGGEAGEPGGSSHGRDTGENPPERDAKSRSGGVECAIKAESKLLEESQEVST